MRILLSCLQSPKRHPIAPYAHWTVYFVGGLEEAGHEVLQVPGVDWVEGIVRSTPEAAAAWRRWTWEMVLDYAKREHQRRPIDLFLSYLYPEQVEVDAIADLQRRGIACVNFYCDNVREFRRVPVEYRPFALHWVPEFEALPMYRAAGLQHVFAPMPCWVSPEFRNIPTSETEPPTFIGSVDLLRRELLGRAVELGADLVVRGAGWSGGPNEPNSPNATARNPIRLLARQIAVSRRHGPTAVLRKLEARWRPLRALPLPDNVIWPRPDANSEYLRISREAVVTLGVNRVPTPTASLRRPTTYSRLRDLEAPMLGACYLTEWTAGLGELYELGSDIEVYRTPEELVEKLAELKADSNRRRSMRSRAQRRALAEHTIGRSVALIAQRLGLKAG